MVKPAKKRATISFQPAPDVQEWIEKAMAEFGNPRGLRSRFINDALRQELGNTIQRYLETTQQAVDRISNKPK